MTQLFLYTGKGIGGLVFKHLTEEKWSSYGISDVGLIVLSYIKGNREVSGWNLL